MPPLGKLLEDLDWGLYTSLRKTNTTACASYKVSCRHMHPNPKKLGSSQKTIKHGLERDIISSLSLVFFFNIRLSGWMKHWIIFT